jgi:uncharacterized protein (DUF1778 family)
MAKSRKLSLRVDDATYRAIEHAAKTLDVSISEYIRLLTLKSAEVVNAGLMDFVVDAMTKDLAHELERWRTYWREHPEKLLQVPERPREEGP